MEINITNAQSDYPINEQTVREITEQVLALEGIATNEVNIYFVDRKKICELHEQFFADPSFTDCISFPIDAIDKECRYHVLGEIFVCPEAAIHYAKSQNLKISHEITLYIIHGLLHLIGYDDIEEKDRENMRKSEKRHFDNLVHLGLDL